MSENWNKICYTVSSTIKKGLGSKPVYNEKYLKTKIKSWKERISTNFQSDKLPVEGSHWICLSLIMVNSHVKIDEKYNLQVFLEDCKHIVVKKTCEKKPFYIADTCEVSAT